MDVERFFREDLPKIQALLKSNSDAAGRQPLSLSLGSVDLSDLLNYSACERVFFFSSKDKNFSFLGLGLAISLTKKEVTGFYQQYPKCFLTTELTFEQTPSEGTYHLHEWNFVCKDNQCTLVMFKNGETRSYSPPTLLLDPNTPVEEEDFIPPWASYEENPEHDEWTRMIEKADELFNNGELQKIVLSRRKIFGYNEILDPFAFFRQLKRKNQKNKSFTIFHQPRFGEAFLSITPEKLFSLEERNFESISLAGSAARGKTEKEDQELEEFLRTDDKLVREHSLVTEELCEKLGPLSEKLDISPLITMKLPYIQHRQADIKATLKQNISALELIELLHPTPAIGGLPWNKARHCLKEIEPFDRGVYAAPIGILSAHYSELAVGIRSAFIQPDKITIFGGAGIVKGSVAEEEWIETGTKMNPFLKVVHNE